jgi:hypothetical protein
MYTWANYDSTELWIQLDIIKPVVCFSSNRDVVGVFTHTHYLRSYVPITLLECAMGPVREKLEERMLENVDSHGKELQTHILGFEDLVLQMKELLAELEEMVSMYILHSPRAQHRHTYATSSHEPHPRIPLRALKNACTCGLTAHSFLPIE